MVLIGMARDQRGMSVLARLGQSMRILGIGRTERDKSPTIHRRLSGTLENMIPVMIAT